MMKNLINKELKAFLINKGAWEAFLGNIQDFSFTKHSSPTQQLLEAFPWRGSAEGYDYWKRLYLCLLE